MCAMVYIIIIVHQLIILVWYVNYCTSHLQ